MWTQSVNRETLPISFLYKKDDTSLSIFISAITFLSLSSRLEIDRQTDTGRQSGNAEPSFDRQGWSWLWVCVCWFTAGMWVIEGCHCKACISIGNCYCGDTLGFRQSPVKSQLWIINTLLSTTTRRNGQVQLHVVQVRSRQAAPSCWKWRTA